MSTENTNQDNSFTEAKKSTLSGNKGLNYKLRIISVKNGEGKNGPFLNIRATTSLKKKDTEITAMLFLNRGKKDSKQAPTAASQKAWDVFTSAKAGDVITAYGEIRIIKDPLIKRESAYFQIRSLTTPLEKGVRYQTKTKTNTNTENKDTIEGQNI